jgi:hypothetical protein
MSFLSSKAPYVRPLQVMAAVGAALEPANDMVRFVGSMSSQRRSQAAEAFWWGQNLHPGHHGIPLYLPRELSIRGSIRPLFWKAASVRYSRQTQRFRRCGNVIS